MNQADRKSQLRAHLRQQRNALAPASQSRAAHAVAAQLKTLPAFCSSARIAFYVANDGEIDPAEAVRDSLVRGVRCYVPVIITARKTLQFGEITAQSRYTRNRFGINEPVIDADQLIAADQLDLVLVPLVGFDARGNRIGMGGGFYDATFAFITAQKTARPHLIGLAHDLQCVANITADHWDIPIAAVVTERRMYTCERYACEI